MIERPWDKFKQMATGGEGQEKQGNNPYLQIFGVRSKDRRNPDAGTIPTPIKVTPTGSLKVAIEVGDRIPIASGALDVTETTVFKAQSTWKNVMVLALNVDGTSTRTFTLHHRVNAVAAADSNSIFPKATSLIVGDGKTLDGIGLLKGDIISGLCSTANTVTVYLYGVPA